MDTDPRAHAVRALSHFVISDSTLRETLDEICQITTDALPAAAFAGMTLLDENGRATTGVFTDLESPEIDTAQYDAGNGPCLDAWRLRRVVRIDDTTAPGGAYPEFIAAAVAHGVRSILSLPLHVGDDGLGALNMYSHQPNGFSPEDEQLAIELAAVGSVVLANSGAYWGAFELAQQLDEAMQSRASIEQAKGILMAQDPSIDAERAFDLLRRASQRENVKLRELAARIIEQRA